MSGCDVSEREYIKRRCSTCMRELGSECHARCCQCHGFVQCLECFAYGWEKDRHVRSHPQIIVNPDFHSVFSQDWNLEEEILLLDGISTCGIGNWEDVAHVVRSKTSEECSAHYTDIYLHSESAPTPEDVIKAPIRSLPPLDFSTDPVESCPSDGHEKILAMHGKTEKSNPAEIYGYMPLRHEFDQAYNNDAEHIIDGLTFDEKDTPETLNRKLELLFCYNSQLSRRREATKIVEDAALQYNPIRTLGGKTPAEREIDGKVQTFAPWMGIKKTLGMAQVVREYARTCERLHIREWWRKNGVETLPEGFLMQRLEMLFRDGVLPKAHIDEWNRDIEEFEEYHGCDDRFDAKMLDNKELELCRSLGVNAQYYMGVKDLLLREYTIRGRLSKTQARGLDPEHQREIEGIYSYFVSVGWII